jgi:pimeloyl-ACP methyl ester carboxylesterase
MRPALPAILMIFLFPAVAVHAEEGRFPIGVSEHPAVEGRAAFTLHRPRSAGEEAPLLVILHESGFTGRDVRPLALYYADLGRFPVLCVRSKELGFTSRDLQPVLASIERVKGALACGSVHLLGVRDSARQALLYALGTPRQFRSVIALATDVPLVRPPSTASSLRVLVLKAADDRPAAGRESVERIRERVEVAEFRTFIGDPRMPDPATRQYVVHFVEAAAGRGKAGRDRSLPWRELAPGLAERARRKARALVYLYDDHPDARVRTRRIQNEILFDTELREAAKSAVPIMAHRDEAARVAPRLHLKNGPALVVLDEEGKVVGVIQRRPSAAALINLLSS